MATAATSDAPDLDEAFFNDLNHRKDSPPRSPPTISSMLNPDGAPRAKRMACIVCRKRKLRCDGARPKCGTCGRLSHECGYDEVRKKSGPKRGYVKLLEARLQQVETMLKTQDRPEQDTTIPEVPSTASLTQNDTGSPTLASCGDNTFENRFPQFQPRNTETGSWEMIGLGLEEPLPTLDAVNELHQIYFQKVHPSVPMIHRPRYLAAMNLAPPMRPPVCLRYAMWTLAASVTDKYSSLTAEFYRRARRYAEADEMKGNGECIITLAHCQTWMLLVYYEFKSMYFPRAWQSTGRAVGMALLLGLNRLDGAGLDVKQCLPPPKDWTEKEERRRTFWMCFSADRYASIGTGWAHRLDERDIMTLLPSHEENFEKSRPIISPSLEQAFSDSAATNVSPISSVILITSMLGRNLTHLHRPTPHDNEEDLNGAFWQRHRQLESTLSNISLALPDHLRLPAGLPDPNVVFMNMLLQTSVICLHQAAIFKAERNQLPQSIISESRARCVTGAAEITRIMKMTSHIDLATLNHFLPFCLYVSARVFVQFLRGRPKDHSMLSSLQFLGQAMAVMSKKNPLTESFMAQLDVDLDGSGLTIWPHQKYSEPVHVFHGTSKQAQSSGMHGGRPPVPAEIPVNTDSVKCSPLFEIRDSQGMGSGDRSVFYSKDSDFGGQIIDMDTSYSQLSPDSLNFQLPNRTKGSSQYGAKLGVMEQVPTPNSEMDFSTTDSRQHKSRSSSYKETSSHASFTPPAGDATSTSGLSKGSPAGASSMPTPGSLAAAAAAASDSLFFEMADASFSNFQQSQFFTAVGPAGFGASASATAPPGSDVAMASAAGAWGDMGGIEATSSTGLSSLVTESWSDVLSGVADWSGVPGEHQGFGARPRRS